MSPVVEADRPVKNRHAVLAPYLERLARAAQAAGGDTLAGKDRWESDIVRGVLGGAGSPGRDGGAPEWWPLVVEGLAFLEKHADDMGRLQSSEAIAAERVTTLHAQLMTDAAIGLSLMEETQRSIDAVVLGGKIDDAKRVTGFRNKLVQAVSSIKETIGPVAFQAAETLSARMIPEARLLRGPAAQGQRPAERRAAHAPTTARRPHAGRAVSPLDERPNYTKPLLVLFGLLVIVWAVFVLPLLNRPTLPAITEMQLPRSGAIRMVNARPPSLYVEIDRAAWSALAESERVQLVDDVGAVAQASGYNGVVFRDGLGKVRAQWMRTGGSTLVKARP